RRDPRRRPGQPPRSDGAGHQADDPPPERGPEVHVPIGLTVGECSPEPRGRTNGTARPPAGAHSPETAPAVAASRASIAAPGSVPSVPAFLYGLAGPRR